MRQSLASQGRLLRTVAVPSPCPPPPPCHTAAVQQGLPGTEKHAALNDILPAFCMLLCLSHLQLSPPNISKTCPKPVTKFIRCICCSFQIHSKIKCQPSLFVHERGVTWKLFYIHFSLLMASPNTRTGAIFHVASHKCQNSIFLIRTEEQRNPVSGAGCQFSFFSSCVGLKALELHPKLHSSTLLVSSARPLSAPGPPCEKVEKWGIFSSIVCCFSPLSPGLDSSLLSLTPRF